MGVLDGLGHVANAVGGAVTNAVKTALGPINVGALHWIQGLANDAFNGKRTADAYKPERKGELPKTTLPDGVQSDNGPKYFGEAWDAYQDWINLHNRSQKLSSEKMTHAADQWKKIQEVLQYGFEDMENGMKTVTSSQWGGDGAKAADAATQKYVQIGETLKNSINAMADNLTNIGGTVDLTKSNMPGKDEVKNWIQDQMNSWYSLPVPDAIDVYFTGDGNSLAFRSNYGALPAQAFQGLFNSAQEQAAMALQGVMRDTYDEGLRLSSQALPDFGNSPAPAPTNPDQTNYNPTPSGPGSPSGVPSGGTPSMPSGTPNIKTPDTPKITPAKITTPNTPTSTNNPLSNLTSGLQQASSLGQNALSQAQNAAKQALSQIDKAKKAGLTTPTGLAALNKAAQAAKLKGLGGGGGGAGGLKGGGGGGAAGLGGKALQSALAKESALAKGLKEAAAVERTMTGRGASATGMGPAGTGAGGARGAGGEDKEHKANKYLRTTLNGEAILGEPIKAVPVVIKD
ncbi:hypothetical protein AAFP30_22185 [Gordonia sp. CPCC 205515]|uniref:hypothetical protein n=1 Tax=Gordonia sp. CPCC 205515 TaxID=3140791 RepID=UPI003AF3FE57